MALTHPEINSYANNVFSRYVEKKNCVSFCRFGNILQYIFQFSSQKYDISNKKMMKNIELKTLKGRNQFSLSPPIFSFVLLESRSYLHSFIELIDLYFSCVCAIRFTRCLLFFLTFKKYSVLGSLP